MKAKEVMLLDNINCEGLDNSDWGVISDVDISSHFGVDDSRHLYGFWLFIWLSTEDTTYICMRKDLSPDIEIKHMDEGEEMSLMLFDVND